MVLGRTRLCHKCDKRKRMGVEYVQNNKVLYCAECKAKYNIKNNKIPLVTFSDIFKNKTGKNLKL